MLRLEIVDKVRSYKLEAKSCRGLQPAAMADDGSIANMTMPGLNCLQRSVGPIVGLGADLRCIIGDRNITITAVGNTGSVTINIGGPSTPAAPAAAPRDLDNAGNVVTATELSEKSADEKVDAMEGKEGTDAEMDDNGRKRKAATLSGILPTRPAPPWPVPELFLRSQGGEPRTPQEPHDHSQSLFDVNLIGCNFHSSSASVPEAIPERTTMVIRSASTRSGGRHSA